MGMKEDLTSVRNSRANVTWDEGGEVPNCVVSFEIGGTFVFKLIFKWWREGSRLTHIMARTDNIITSNITKKYKKGLR